MTHHIVGYLNTEYNLAADAYKIFFDYVAPEPDEDVDKFVAIATRRFGKNCAGPSKRTTNVAPQATEGRPCW